MGKNIRYISLFSGIECVSLAARPLGWTPVAFSEIEPFPSAVLAHHYPEVPNVGDVTAVDWSQYRGRGDLVIGGSPCQSFSIAGKGESLSDPRGQLTLAFAKAVNDVDPAFVVWENVTKILNTHDNAFGHFLAALAGHDSPLNPPDGRGWTSAGVVVGPRRRLAWRVLDAQYFGVPQRRRRVFLVGCPRTSGIDPAEILFESGGMRGDSPARREAGKDVAGTIEASTGRSRGAGISPGSIVGAVSSKWAKGTGGPSGDECQNLVAAMTTRGYADNDGQESRLVVRTLTARGNDGMRLGNSFDLQGGLQVAHTLRGEGFDASEDGTGRGTSLVTFGIQDGIVNRRDDNGPQGKGYFREQSPTVLGNGKPYAIAFTQNQCGDVLTGDVCGALGTNQNATGRNTAKVMASGVRRLTPRECERLQGIPDDYTLVPYRGKPAADGPRYKAIGNGMAVLVVAWIMRRIDRAFTSAGSWRRDPGISLGFPLPATSI